MSEFYQTASVTAADATHSRALMEAWGREQGARPGVSGDLRVLPASVREGALQGLEVRRMTRCLRDRL